jgi:hypothetical protein
VGLDHDGKCEGACRAGGDCDPLYRCGNICRSTGVAKAQKDIAYDKLKFDLMDKRYALYVAKGLSIKRSAAQARFDRRAP